MSVFMSLVRHWAGRGLLCASFAGLTPVIGQIASPQIPLDTFGCTSFGNSESCGSDGTRTVTVTTPFTSTLTPGGLQVNGAVHVDFDGRLRVAGVPVTGSLQDPALLFGFSSPATVDLAASFDATVDETANFGTVKASPGFDFNIISQNVRSIDLNVASGAATDVTTGDEYSYSLSTVDPTAIVDNAVQLTGRYRSDPESGGALIFGRISGTATLLSGRVVTDTDVGSYLSPFAVRSDITVQETTRLDENGLTTPRVTVTDGIDMNGSRITELGDGIDPADAVNRRQLDAETSARTDADTAFGQQLGAETSARTAADTAFAQQLGAETSARIATDNAQSTRLDALGARIDGLDSRLRRLDRRADAGTAAAMALGGAIFLPDTHFNLSANVATYGHAQAAAVQVGALVSRHVAVNAGVTTGLNHGGRTGGRAGLTIGW